ncbi:hypothetical protein H4Q26_007436 [Puccinia striiformis f. sp. tritici PST-130]|nr:hypothetical protein H4Q26_007436 [Puccinia striiformis f. sp. tritici PST-130]
MRSRNLEAMSQPPLFFKPSALWRKRRKSPEPVGHTAVIAENHFLYSGWQRRRCGKTHQDSDYIVPFKGMYGGTFAARLSVTRVSTGQSIECVAADECPGCPSTYSLDLSTGAFNALERTRVFLISSGMSKNKPREEYRTTTSTSSMVIAN